MYIFMIYALVDCFLWHSYVEEKKLSFGLVAQTFTPKPFG